MDNYVKTPYLTLYKKIPLQKKMKDLTKEITKNKPNQIKLLKEYKIANLEKKKTRVTEAQDLTKV